MISQYLEVRTASRSQMVNITQEVAGVVTRGGVQEGLCLIHVPHTTAGVTINEGADPAVVRDVLTKLDEMVPWSSGYSHTEGNSAAHIKSSMVGHSARVAVRKGRLRLGTWQAIFFCEFDGPRRRRVEVSVLEG
jgi:secondary thiamine-phosphate synthase enzyme